MSSFYIFSYRFEEKTKDVEANSISATVIFCSSEEIDESDLQNKIIEFYQQHYQTDRVLIIGSSNIETRLKQVFVQNMDETFKGIPRRHETALADSIHIAIFDNLGILKPIHGKFNSETLLSTFIKEGLQRIFIDRGGLIVAESAHHYVFPSKKHCDRFLRTGNILLYSAEIFFIAFSLLKHYKEEQFSRIYCDTSSINSVAFALFELKNRFLEKKLDALVESFSSYEGLYNNPEQYTKDAFILISASTSANIIKYLLSLQTTIDRENIVVMYFLAGQTGDVLNVIDQILCDLTLSESNPNGIPPYTTYKETECQLCKNGSYAVPVSGDVFLLESPKVNTLLLSKNDREKNLSKFVSQFRKHKGSGEVLKVHYKAHNTEKYEVYIDFERILEIIEEKHLKEFKNKLDQYINQYIPGKTKYLLHLMDDGSLALTKYVYSKLAGIYKDDYLPIILDQDSLAKIKDDVDGAVVVIGSCISNGKNLLYISRALREFQKLEIVYFIGLLRTADQEYADILEDNLTMGRYGSGTFGFHAASKMFCSNSSRTSPWIEETKFLKDIIYFLSNKDEVKSSLEYFKERKKIIDTASGDENKGFSNNIFYPRITTNPHEELQLRRGFAFWDFGDYHGIVTQADVYFTISNILNSLRHSKNPSRQLKQAIYVRNVLSPTNFNRFNDGIIQSSLLRAAHSEELSYDIDPQVSQEMYEILETTILYYKQEQGEALLEFLYAIAIRKLRLLKIHIKQVLEIVRQECTEELFRCLANYIEFKLIVEPEELKKRSIESFG